MKSPLVWIAIAVIAVVVYLLVMRVFARDSKEVDKRIDPSKMKPWKDDD